MNQKYQHLILALGAFFSCAIIFVVSVSAQSKPVASNSPVQIKRGDFAVVTKLNDLKIDDTVIQIAVSETKNSNPVYFRPHENEQTASQAVAIILKKYGGKFVEIKSRGERLIQFNIKQDLYTFDPNRIFSVVGISATLKYYGKTSPAAEKAIGDFVATLVKNYLFAGKDTTIVAVHNNTDEGSLSMETQEFSPMTDLTDIYVNEKRDIDDFFYVTNRRDFEFFKAKNFNVVLQNNKMVTDDGSLSVYCGKRNIRYINIEAEHGHLTEQIEMLEIVQELLAGK